MRKSCLIGRKIVDEKHAFAVESPFRAEDRCEAVIHEVILLISKALWGSDRLSTYIFRLSCLFKLAMQVFLRQNYLPALVKPSASSLGANSPILVAGTPKINRSRALVSAT